VLSSRATLVTRAGSGKTAPYTVTPAGLKVIEAMAAEGQDQATIARKLGLHRKTLMDIVKRCPDVEEVMASGKALLADELTHHLLTAARKGNVVAAIYLTKARLGWVEGDRPETRPNIIINLPDAATPEAYLRAVSVMEQPKPKDDSQ
jgi:hypothetical protein